jgi:hypothetical protein
MNLPTESHPHFPSLPPVGREGEGGDGILLQGQFAVLDSSLEYVPIMRDQKMRECANCGGPSLFVPVDRFPFGWRGYCLGCEEVVYVMDERTSVEVA